MVESFLAIANFLLPQSVASSRPLLGFNTVIFRLSLSLTSFQTDKSRAYSSNGKRKEGRADIGDDHAFEHSDWSHIAQRKSSLLIYGQFHAEILFLSSIQTAPFTALAAFGSRPTVYIPPCPTPPLYPRSQSTLYPVPGKAKVYDISAAKHRRFGTATLARPNTYLIPP